MAVCQRELNLFPHGLFLEKKKRRLFVMLLTAASGGMEKRSQSLRKSLLIFMEQSTL